MDENEEGPRRASGKLGLAAATAALALLVAATSQMSAQGVAWGLLALALTFWFGLTVALGTEGRRTHRARHQTRQNPE